MVAAKGNDYAKGNKGGGRKSAYQELADATEAFAILFGDQDQAVLERKIQSGKFSLADRLKLNGMEGDSAILLGVMKKALPDIARIDHTTKGESFIPLATLARHVDQHEGETE